MPIKDLPPDLSRLDYEALAREHLAAEADAYEALKRDAFHSPAEAAAAVDAQRDPGLLPALATQLSLALRERALYDAAPNADAAKVAIAADRLARWTAHQAAMGGAEHLPTLERFAAGMARRYGALDAEGAFVPQPQCRMHGIAMPWLTALLVLQYGESEYFWPTAWTEQDVERAQKWYDGRKSVSPSKGFAPVVEG